MFADKNPLRKSPTGNRFSILPPTFKPPNRPQIHANVEGLLKGELAHAYVADRNKILTSEQQKVLWKKNEKVRDAERKMEKAMENFRVTEEEGKRQALQLLYANVIQERIQEKKIQVRSARKVKAEEARLKAEEDFEKQRMKEEAEAEQMADTAQKVAAQNHLRKFLERHKHHPKHEEENAGESAEIGIDEHIRGRSLDRQRPTRTYSSGSQEVPGEYGDAEWPDAEQYGYSSQFPYHKKNAHLNKHTDHSHRNNEHLGEMAGEEGDEVSVLGFFDGLTDGLFHIDKAAESLARVMGKKYGLLRKSPRVPVNTPFAYQPSDGESELYADVGTDVKPLTPANAIRPPHADAETQVTWQEIKDAIAAAIEADRLARELKLKQEIEDEELRLRLEQKESRRIDDFTMTRPVGYKELELSLPIGPVMLDEETQAFGQQIDQEYAIELGLILPDDNILWPTVDQFDIEMAAKRIEVYIRKCWSLDPKWMHYIQPVQTIADDYKKRYIFEARFSVPTPLNPIPAATASVYFIFEISHYASRDDFVKVHYIVEGTRFVHATGTLPFQDKWLWSIISDKVRLQRSIDF